MARRNYWGVQKPPVRTQASQEGAARLDLVGAWLFNENAGPLVTDSSRAQNLGACGANVSFQPGLFGSSLLFNGAGFVTLTDNPSIYNLATGSALAWINLTSTGNSDFFGRFTGISSTSQYFAMYNYLGVLGCCIADGTTRAIIESGSGGVYTLPSGVWIQVGMTWDGATLTQYVNGIPVATVGYAFTAGTSSAVSLQIGKTGVITTVIPGAIDHVLIGAKAWLPTEFAKLYAEPFWWMDAPRQVSVKKPSSGVTCIPGKLALALTTYAPTVLTPRVCIPSTLALTTTGRAPVIALAVIPATKALTLTKYAPTVLTPRVCIPGVKALTLTGYAPTVLTPRVCIPGTLALTLTGYAPTVLAPRVCTPGKLALTLTGYAPTVLAPRVCIPDAGALSLTGYAPTISVPSATPVLCTPDALTLALTTYAPTVIGSPSHGPGWLPWVPHRRSPLIRTEREKPQQQATQPEPKAKPVSATGLMQPGLIRVIGCQLRGVVGTLAEGLISAGLLSLASRQQLGEAYVTSHGNLIEGLTSGWKDRQRRFRRLAAFEDLTRQHRGRPVPVEELMECLG